jgi:hypothetical protein
MPNLSCRLLLSLSAPFRVQSLVTDRLCVQSLLCHHQIAHLDTAKPRTRPNHSFWPLYGIYITKMKRATQALPLAVLAATASAQVVNTVVGNNPALSGTTTITYSICPTAATLTTTLPGTITLCPGPYCDGGSPTVTLGPGQGGVLEGGYTTIGPNGESTVYETFYPATCSTGGLAPVTYMITEACPCEASRASDYVPSGFSTTVATVLTKTCANCAEVETTVTLTTPCATGPYATAGYTTPAGGAAPAATGAEAGGYTPGATEAAVATGAGAAPAYSAGSNAGSGSGSNTNTNTTINPPITPIGGNAASDVGENPSTFTGAAQKIDVVGFAASAFFALFVGAAAWWL